LIKASKKRKEMGMSATAPITLDWLNSEASKLRVFNISPNALALIGKSETLKSIPIERRRGGSPREGHLSSMRGAEIATASPALSMSKEKTTSSGARRRCGGLDSRCLVQQGGMR
jgi:hypothetical protein